MEKLIIQYPISKNKIIFHVFEEFALIKELCSDNEYPKIFFNIISDAERKLKEKKVKDVYQEVLLNDYEKSLKDKTTWVIKGHKIDPEFGAMVLIECNINSFSENIHLALSL